MIPAMYTLHAEVALLRYSLPEDVKPYFDWWFEFKFGFPYGHEPEPFSPELQAFFPKHKQPPWYAEEQIPG